MPCHKSSTVALNQSRMNPLLERCCMGVVNQIIDLDNSSKPLPYKSTGTFTVGEGLAPPETFVKMPSNREANSCFRRDDHRSSA